MQRHLAPVGPPRACRLRDAVQLGALGRMRTRHATARVGMLAQTAQNQAHLDYLIKQLMEPHITDLNQELLVSDSSSSDTRSRSSTYPLLLADFAVSEHSILDATLPTAPKVTMTIEKLTSHALTNKQCVPISGWKDVGLPSRMRDKMAKAPPHSNLAIISVPPWVTEPDPAGPHLITPCLKDQATRQHVYHLESATQATREMHTVSYLTSCAAVQPQLVLVVHPLVSLLRCTLQNRMCMLSGFFSRYRLAGGVVFSSAVYGVRPELPVPLIAALYVPGQGGRDNILNTHLQVLLNDHATAGEEAKYAGVGSVAATSSGGKSSSFVATAVGTAADVVAATAAMFCAAKSAATAQAQEQQQQQGQVMVLGHVIDRYSLSNVADLPPKHREDLTRPVLRLASDLDAENDGGSSSNGSRAKQEEEAARKKAVAARLGKEPSPLGLYWWCGQTLNDLKIWGMVSGQHETTPTPLGTYATAAVQRGELHVAAYSDCMKRRFGTHAAGVFGDLPLLARPADLDSAWFRDACILDLVVANQQLQPLQRPSPSTQDHRQAQRGPGQQVISPQELDRLRRAAATAATDMPPGTPNFYSLFLQWWEEGEAAKKGAGGAEAYEAAMGPWWLAYFAGLRSEALRASPPAVLTAGGVIGSSKV